MVEGGTAHGKKINDQLLSLQGVPPSPYIKEWRRGRRPASLGVPHEAGRSPSSPPLYTGEGAPRRHTS